MSRQCVALLIAIGIPTISHAAPQDLTVFEDFEGFSPNTTVGEPILLGDSPVRAALTDNSFAGAVGVGSLYHSGIRSWMVLEQSVALIDFFEENATMVEFFIKTHPDADGDTVVTAFDDMGQALGAPIVIGAGFHDPADPLGRGFTFVSFSGDIDHLTVANNATNFMNAVDDFGFDAVPEPSAAVLLSAGALASMACARRIRGSLAHSRRRWSRSRCRRTVRIEPRFVQRLSAHAVQSPAR